MSIGGLVLALLLALLAAVIVLRPLWRAGHGNNRPSETIDQRRGELLAAYERVLTNILDLDEDLATGKIRPGDHERERESWLERGIAALRALDGMEAAPVATPNEAEAARIDRAIEDAVNAQRGGTSEMGADGG